MLVDIVFMPACTQASWGEKRRRAREEGKASSSSIGIIETGRAAGWQKFDNIQNIFALIQITFGQNKCSQLDFQFITAPFIIESQILILICINNL